MGLKEFFYNYNVLFPPLSPIFQHSNIPAFHSDETNRMPLINLYYQKVVEIMRRLIKGWKINQ